MKHKCSKSYLGIVITISLLSPVLALGESGQAPTPEARSATPAKPRPIPFHGTVKTIDMAAKTLSVGNRVFQITTKTRISKEGKPAGLNAGTTGERVSGSY